MIIRIKKVYYCGFCRKHSLRPLTEHEKHCTANPDRYCRLCNTKRDIKSIIEKVRASITIQHDPSGNSINNITSTMTIGDIWNLLDENCPACMLAILRQSTKGFGYSPFHNVFDYKKELAEWWENINSEEDHRQDY